MYFRPYILQEIIVILLCYCVRVKIQLRRVKEWFTNTNRGISKVNTVLRSHCFYMAESTSQVDTSCLSCDVTFVAICSGTRTRNGDLCWHRTKCLRLFFSAPSKLKGIPKLVWDMWELLNFTTLIFNSASHILNYHQRLWSFSNAVYKYIKFIANKVAFANSLYYDISLIKSHFH